MESATWEGDKSHRLTTGGWQTDTDYQQIVTKIITITTHIIINVINITMTTTRTTITVIITTKTTTKLTNYNCSFVGCFFSQVA